MHIPFLPTFIFFCFITYFTEAFARLKFHTKREKLYEIPMCTADQSCYYQLDEFQFELCYCPDYSPCPMSPEFRVHFNKLDYQFCTRRNFKTCEPDSIVARLTLLQTSVFCHCPEDSMYIEREGTDLFICKEKPICEPTDVCNSDKTGPCRCPLGTLCDMSAVNSTCQMY